MKKEYLVYKLSEDMKEEVRCASVLRCNLVAKRGMR